MVSREQHARKKTCATRPDDCEPSRLKPAAKATLGNLRPPAQAGGKCWSAEADRGSAPFTSMTERLRDGTRRPQRAGATVARGAPWLLKAGAAVARDSTARAAFIQISASRAGRASARRGPARSAGPDLSGPGQ